MRSARRLGDGQRLDITLQAAEHRRLFADLEALLGAPGSGEWHTTSPAPHAPPAWVVASWKLGELTGTGLVRACGSASLAACWTSGIGKLPLRLHLGDHDVDGVRRVALLPAWRDPSTIRARLASILLRKAGVPAPPTALLRVYVDVGEGPAYLGLYTAIEEPGESLPRDWFRSEGGPLYEVRGPGATWEAFDRDSFRKASPEGDWRDVMGAIEAVHGDRSDALGWRERLERQVDVVGFLTWLAANSVIRNPIAYGQVASHYFLYGVPAEGGRLAWIPWTTGAAFPARGRRVPLMHDLQDASWPLIRLLLDDPMYRQMYRDAVLAFVRGPFAIDAMRDRITGLHDLAAPWVIGPDGERPGFTHVVSEHAFERSLEELLSFVENRHAEVDRELRADAAA